MNEDEAKAERSSIVERSPSRNEVLKLQELKVNFYKEDSKGNITSKDFSDRRLKIYDRPLRLPLHQQSPPMSKKNNDLERLEDAIYSHTIDGKSYPYRSEYLTVFDEVRESSEDINDYISELNTSRYKALRHCWDILKWRPNKEGTKVYTLAT